MFGWGLKRERSVFVVGREGASDKTRYAKPPLKCDLVDQTRDPLKDDRVIAKRRDQHSRWSTGCETFRVTECLRLTDRSQFAAGM